MKIVISGSSSGIGRAISEQLLPQHQVIGLARQHDKFVPESNNYYPYPIDFADMTHLESHLKTIQKAHSDIDAIICCAGYGQFSALEQFSVSQIQNLMQVNFLSQVVLIKTFLPAMKQRQSGKIIILGSEAALQGEKQGSIYCASKFALRGFSQSLRKECSHQNIAVSLINPGFVNTPFFDHLKFSPQDPMQDASQAEQIASLVLQILANPTNCVLEEITIQPLVSRLRS